MPEQCVELIDNIIELRKEKGWTQQELHLNCEVILDPLAANC